MRKLQTSAVSLNEVINLTEEQAKTRYNIGRNKLMEISDCAGATVRAGKRRLYSRLVLDNYFNHHTE